MPKILIYKNLWIFIIYATDANENRMHIHVGKKSMFNLCKIWLEPNVEIAQSGDLTLKQQNEILQITDLYKEELIQQWKDFISGKTIKTIKVK